MGERIDDLPCCAHLTISYRTEPCDGPDIRGEMIPGFAVRGWWECDSNCGARFLPSGSLTAARLRLADAAERLDKAAKATTWCHTVFGTEEECAAWYAKVGYTEADALAVEEECYAARTEYDLALAALRTARGEG